MDIDEFRAALTGVPGWRKSSYSAGASGCVELNSTIPGHIGIRDSKLGEDSPILLFGHREIRAFLSDPSLRGPRSAG